MTGGALTVFGILAGAVALFALGRPRSDVVAILVVLALSLTRLEQSDEISHERLAETQGVIESGAKMWC